MKKKQAIILVVTSIILWYISTLLQAFIDLAIFNHTPIIGSTQCTGTGYPIALCIKQNTVLTGIISLGNIALIVLGIKYIQSLRHTT